MKQGLNSRNIQSLLIIVAASLLLTSSSDTLVNAQHYTGYEVKMKNKFGQMGLFYTKNQFYNMYTIELDSYENWPQDAEIRMSLEFQQNYDKATERIVFYCSPKLTRCSDVRMTREQYEMSVSQQSDMWQYLTARPKDDEDMDDRVGGLFDLTVGRNDVDPMSKTVVLDFTFSEKPNQLTQDSVVLKWGVFDFPDSDDMLKVRGSINPLSFFNKMSFSDIYDDRQLLFKLNTLNWILSFFWVFGLPIMCIITLIEGGYLFLKLLECYSRMTDTYTDLEQVKLFAFSNFLWGPVVRWTITNMVLTTLMFAFTLIPGLGFLVNTYLWSMTNMINYTMY